MEDAEEGLTLCTARPEFAALSEADVMKVVVNDKYAESPITAEVTRLGCEFMVRFRAYVEEHGYIEPRLMRVEARCPIEKVAIQTVVHFVDAHLVSVRSAAVH